jgi:hypothetical protein
MRLLQFDEIHDRAEIVAEVQIARRLDARKDPLGKSHNQVPVCPWWNAGQGA